MSGGPTKSCPSSLLAWLIDIVSGGSGPADKHGFGKCPNAVCRGKVKLTYVQDSFLDRLEFFPLASRKAGLTGRDLQIMQAIMHHAKIYGVLEVVIHVPESRNGWLRSRSG